MDAAPHAGRLALGIGATQREFTVAVAIIADSPLLRGGLTAVLWLKSPPCPTKVVTTMAEALDFCLDALARAGVSGLEPAEQLRGELFEARKT